ncbi:MAG: hypothetical protein E6L02_07610 [Thaumarchaeota archaeon]|nr:MAG: hypothetical protein E6L02_07610 [Nitrososphaerota archaeon]
MSLILGWIPIPAHAYTVPNTASVGWSSAVSSAQTITIANTGDRLIVNIQVADGTNAGQTSVSVVSVVDTMLNTFTKAVSKQLNFAPNCSAGNCFDDEIWSTVTGSSGSDTVTVTQTQSSASGSNFQLVDVAGLPANSLLIATAIGNSGNIADSSVFTSCSAAGTRTAGTGYTLLGNIAPFVGDSEYGNPSSPPSSPTNFPSSCSISGKWIDIGVIFGVAPSTGGPTIIIIPPNQQIAISPLPTVSFNGIYLFLFPIQKFILDSLKEISNFISAIKGVTSNILPSSFNLVFYIIGGILISLLTIGYYSSRKGSRRR